MREYVLIVAAGTLFGLICLVIIVIEQLAKLIAIPVMLCFGIGVLAGDHIYQRFLK